MKNLIFLFAILTFLSSCEKKEHTASEKAVNTVSLQKLDSIQIYYLGTPIIHDIDPLSKTVLFMEQKEFLAKILVADFDGKFLHSFLKSGDVPDSYGGLISTLRIESDSSFIAYGSNGFLRYDFSGKLLSQVDHKDFQPPIFKQLAMQFGMKKIGDRYIFEEQDYRGVNVRDSDHYKDLYLLSWLDPETGEREPFLKIPETSIFRNGKYFFAHSWKPIFTISNDIIYVAFGIEPVIYAFDSEPPYTLVKRIPLDLKEYRYYKGGNDYSSVANFMHLRNSTGRIEAVKIMDGYYIISYFPGFNKVDIEQSLMNKSPEEAKIFRERMQEKYPNRIAIFDSLGNRLNDFVPKGLVAEEMLLRNGELWMVGKEDPNTEKDYFMLYNIVLKKIE